MSRPEDPDTHCDDDGQRVLGLLRQQIEAVKAKLDQHREQMQAADLTAGSDRSAAEV
jgi:hypothetical protein